MRRSHAPHKLALLGLLISLACATATTMAANSPALPTSFAGWNQTGSAQSIGESADPRWPDLWPIFQEYGYASGTLQQYTKANQTISVSLYRMKDPSGAYGAYSYLRTPEMSHANFTEHSSISSRRALILDGATVIEIMGSPADLQKFESDIKSLVSALAIPPADGPYPDLVKRLPIRGFQQGTDRYILGPAALKSLAPIADGDWAGFANGAEVELGQYRAPNGNHAVTLIIIDYPTPQVATKMLKDWNNQFNLDAKDPESKKPAIFTARKLTTVGIVAGAATADEAKAILSYLESGEELTWNEPTFSVNEGNINGVIASVIVGTGILCMFTLVAGLAFGGVRLVAKRFLPGRVFDRGSSISVLQLGLGSKPINSDDFYQLGKNPSRLPPPSET
jgi:hypothetical protein